MKQTVRIVTRALIGLSILAAGTLRPTAAQSQPDLVWLVGGHSTGLTSVAVSSSGQLLASATAVGDLKIWQAQDGTLLHTLADPGSGFLRAIAFSPNEQIVASVNTLFPEFGGIGLWRVSDGALLRRLPGSVKTFAFSPDGHTIATATGHFGTFLRIWNSEDGTFIDGISRDLTGNSSSTVSLVAFSPDGQILAVARANNTIQLWDASSGTLLRTLIGQNNAGSIAFSPDGQTLAAGEASTLKFWRVSDGTLLRALAAQGLVNSIAFSPDGQTLASAQSDHTIRLRQGSDGTLRKTLLGHINSVFSVAFFPDGQSLLSGSTDNTL